MKHLLTLAFSLLTFYGISQHPGGGHPGGRPGRPGGLPEGSGVVGKIQDENGINLPYVSVVLYAASDSSMVGGTASDTTGRFKLDAEPGNYFLKLSFMSYDDLYVNDLVLGEERKRLGRLQMKVLAEALDEMVVETQQSIMELRLDKRVFNVGADLMNKGADASELLDNIPSVTVDVDGNVSLRGSQNVRILIDGKPSSLTGMSGADALRMIQADMIERVEVITNPSARYDAEGEVGILNIVLKKDVKKGVNGSVNLRVGYPGSLAGSFRFTVQKKRFNFFTGYGANYRQGPGSGYSEQKYFFEDTSYSYIRDEEHSRGGLSHNFRAGMGYDITDRASITVSGMHNISAGENYSAIVYSDYDLNNELSQVVNRREDETDGSSTNEINVDFRKSFEEKGRSLTASARWNDSYDDEHSGLTEVSSLLSEDSIIQRSWSYEHENRLTAQIDYVHPFKKDGVFEAGAKAQLRSYSNKYGVDDQEGAIWIAKEDFTNSLIYLEDIYAAYLMAGNKTGKFSYQGGLRAELSDVTTQLLKTNEINPRQYLNFFPSVHTSYEFEKGLDFQLSYSRRLNRPRHWWLMPFFSYNDSRNFFSGNPNLNPEFVDSYEAALLKKWDKGTLMSSVYYRHTTGKMERILTSDSTGFTMLFPINLGVQDNYGFEFSGNYDMTKWWSFMANANFFRSIQTGEYEGVSYNADTYAWSGRITSKWRVKRKFSAQMSFNYRSPKQTTQGSQLAMYNWDTALSADVLKGNGTLSFSARDLLNSRKRRNYSVGETFDIYSEFQWRARSFNLNFTYRINQKKTRDKQGYEGDMDMGM